MLALFYSPTYDTTSHHASVILLSLIVMPSYLQAIGIKTYTKSPFKIIDYSYLMTLYLCKHNT